MGDCSEAGTWSHASPTRSGFYDVRPRLAAWNVAPAYEAPGARITYVDVASGRFDAGSFGGNIADPLWEWRGPIEVPMELPEQL